MIILDQSSQAIIDAIPSHLHPVTLRSNPPKPTNTVNTASIAQSTTDPTQFSETQLRKLPSFVPPPPESPLSTASSSSSSSSTFDQDQDQEQDADRSHIAGLQINHSAYPLLSTLKPNSPHSDKIKLITCSDYANIYESYLRSASQVDESVVFPYLHCHDRYGSAQASYFNNPRARRGLGTGISSLPSYRGLTIISADGPRRTCPTPTTNPNHRRTQSFQSSSSSRTTSTSSSFGITSPTSSPATSIEGPGPKPSLLLSSLSPDQILERNSQDGSLLGRFFRKPLPSQSAVNLRLFGHQPGQYATISDIIIYGETGLSSQVLEIAALCVEAQRDFKNRHSGLMKVEYKVFVVVDEFSKFEREFSSLVGVDGWGFRRFRVDFFERERVEMETLTCASEIEHNVFMGNSADALRDENVPIENRKFTVFIEAHDSARILGRPELDMEATKLLTNPYLNAHLEVPSTGPVGAGQQLSVEILLRSLDIFCGWISRMASHGKKVLIHCHDGYTETSMFGLAYLIHARRIPLSSAYLHLQTIANRSFFVYPSDLTLLKHFERRTIPPPLTIIQTWIHHPNFDGHFPSRILPFLYLGNLSHASNPNMLIDLGITAIVSMGESVQNTLSGFQSKLDILDVKAVADDGLDRISDHFLPTFKFIEKHRKLGGKILVHCRVGVSRSATIVIGYLMAHARIDLASAYLLVRSRRLNILIQPNLVFMWALRRWESVLNFTNIRNDLMDGDNQLACGCGVCGKEVVSGHGVIRRGSRSGSGIDGQDIKFKAWSWSSLALEISLLNQRYLC